MTAKKNIAKKLHSRKKLSNLRSWMTEPFIEEHGQCIVQLINKSKRTRGIRLFN